MYSLHLWSIAVHVEATKYSSTRWGYEALTNEKMYMHLAPRLSRKSYHVNPAPTSPTHSNAVWVASFPGTTRMVSIDMEIQKNVYLWTTAYERHNYTVYNKNKINVVHSTNLEPITQPCSAHIQVFLCTPMTVPSMGQVCSTSFRSLIKNARIANGPNHDI